MPLNKNILEKIVEILSTLSIFQNIFFIIINAPILLNSLLTVFI